MSGDERLWLGRAGLTWGGLIVAIATVNVLGIQHKAPLLGALEPAIWEASSALLSLVLFFIPAAAILWMVRSRPRWWIAAPGHLIAVVTYSALHVWGFVVLRQLAYATLLHRDYRFGSVLTEFPYELRKDMMAYGLATMLCWFALQRGAQGLPTPTSPAVFDIQDGPRLIRVPVAEILAVRAAGNYVEFILGDGRRPLSRSSLSRTLARLARHGFVQTHKSWVVNPAHVTGLRPERSGDYVVALGGHDVPLSRRFRDALLTLRGQSPR